EGSPIVLTLSAPHNYVTGDKVYVTGVVGNGAANGITPAITVPSTADENYNKTHVILTGFDSTGEYETGGTIQLITNGLREDEEIGRIVRIIAGTGRNQVRKIIGNSQTTLTIDGTWAELPDETSVFIVEDHAWLTETPTTPTE